MFLDKITSMLPLNRNEPFLGNQLQKGDIFRAVVVDMKDGQAILRIRGELQTAISSVHLSPGETALFLVRDIKEGLLILKKQEQLAAGFGEKTLGSLLKELGLPVTPEGQKIVAHLLSKELPLSKKFIESTLKELSRMPENMKETFIKITAWLYGAGIEDSQSYQNVLKTLLYSKENLNFLADLMDAAATVDKETVKNQLAELIMAQKDINQSKQENHRQPDLFFYPLPLLKKGCQIPAQLYLVLKNSSQPNLEGFQSILLSVKGEKLGILWFEIKVQDMNLNITAYTERPEVSAYLTETWIMLKDALKTYSFQVNSFVCREKEVASVFELADELGQDTHYRSVDIMI